MQAYPLYVVKWIPFKRVLLLCKSAATLLLTHNEHPLALSYPKTQSIENRALFSKDWVFGKYDRVKLCPYLFVPSMGKVLAFP